MGRLLELPCLSLQLLNHSGDEGDDHNWSIPSAVSTEEHKEITVRQILHHLGTCSSDALESKILEFFAHRTALALSQKIRPLMAHELQANVSAFLNLRPDGYALHHKSKRLAILEFTRAMDSSEDWEEKKDAEKRSRYAHVLEFFNSL